MESPAIKSRFRRDNAFFQTCHRSNDLKNTPRLICIVDGGIAPHGIEGVTLLLGRKSFPCRRQFRVVDGKGLIQVKRGIIRHGINLPVLWVHHNERAFFRLFGLYGFCQCLFRILLYGYIQCRHQISTIHWRNPFLFLRYLTT